MNRIHRRSTPVAQRRRRSLRLVLVVVAAASLSAAGLAGAHTTSLPITDGRVLRIFDDRVPETAVVEDRAAVELGVQLRSSVDGWITGVRLYSGADTSGSKVASLWTASGTLLARADVPKAGLGWQETQFVRPVLVDAGTTYVASYFTPDGLYASDREFFSDGPYTNGPLTALASLYDYGGSPRFPTSSYKGSNYYVDTLFVADTTAAVTPPTTTVIAPPTTTTIAPPTTTTIAPPTTTTIAPPTTTTTMPATTSTTRPPTAGYTVGSGASAMVFPEKPGLTVSESSLTPYTGPRRFESAGTFVFSNCLVTGKAITFAETVDADVTFRNCKFLVDDYRAMFGHGGGTITIEHSLFDGSLTGNEPALSLEGHGSVVRYSEFINDTDHIRLGSNATAEWNWIHQTLAQTADGGAHADGIEVYYANREKGAPATGPHVFVRSNYIEVSGAEGENAALNVTNDFGPIDGVRIEGNTFMQGGGYSLYLRDDGYCGCGGLNRNIEVLDNRWFASVKDRWGGYYGTHSSSPPSGITAWSGNVLHRADGSTVAISPNVAKP